MASTFDRRALLVGGAATAAGIAGMGALDWDGLAGASISSAAHNGVTTAKPKRGGSLVFGVDAEESGFDPTQARYDEVGVIYARTVFDPLTIITNSGNWAPYLAQSVVPNANYTSWVITLRPNVVFHDGTPCNGAALLTNLKAQAKSLLTGLIINPILDTITQTGPLACTLTFKTPWAPFPYYLAGGIGGQIAYVVAPSMLANPNGTSRPVGTGPFVFKEWVPNSHFIATANPHYWRPGLPYLSQITYKPIPDEQTRAEALRAGTIDLMITDTPQISAQFKNNKSYGYTDDSVHLAGEPDIDCQLLNCDKAPFNDPSLRRAAAMAINNKQYRASINDNLIPIATGLFAPGSPYYSKTSYPAFNPTEAKKLVKAAVAKGGEKAVSLTYGSTNGPASQRSQQFIQQQLQEVGFKVTNNSVEQNDLINIALAGTYQMLNWRQFGAVDPDLNYIFWSTTTASSGSLSINMARNSDPKLEFDLQLGRSSLDPAIRAKAYKAVNQRLSVDLPYLWQDRSVWSVVSTLKAQNWNNPTTPTGAKAFGLIGGSVWPTQIWIS
ncbi:MAG TPA: ABC transporter substrate-binding protein [Acidimicrobiales bacterium]